MGSYLKSLLDEDVHYDEANPRYRFLFSSTHCLTILKYILVVHVISTVIVSLYTMPFSIFIAPAMVIILGTAVFSLKSEDHIALVPFQLYLFGLFVANCIASIVCPVAVYFYKDELLGHLGFFHTSSNFVTSMLILNVVLVYLVMAGLLYWQWTVCTACREYFRKIREQSNYAHLSVPESFALNPAEHQPFAGKKSADYMVYTLDQVDLDSSNEDEKKVEVIVNGEKEKSKI